jgi:hypothetical protein
MGHFRYLCDLDTFSYDLLAYELVNYAVGQNASGKS